MFRLVRRLTHAGEFLLTCPYRAAHFLFATFIFNPALPKRWAANHFPLAQRTGGQELYGVEQTGLILFGEQASALTRPEQYVLAAAVNRRC